MANSKSNEKTPSGEPPASAWAGSGAASAPSSYADVAGFTCIDHVAIAVRAGELESQVAAFRLLGFAEVHREDVLGGDQVREVLLRIGGGPNLIQLLEPLQATHRSRN